MPLDQPATAAVIANEGPIRLSRRRFVMAAGALTVGVAFGDALAADAPHGPLAPNAWVTIGADETVTLAFALAEMGQGIMTTLPLAIAEEMDADWARVRVVQSPCDGKVYGLNGVLSTFGSSSVRLHFERLRIVGAQARKVLLACAAAKLGVPAGELSTEPGRVLHAATGRSISYGQIAATAALPDPLPAATKDDLKKPAQFRYIGRKLPRVDVPSKVDGTAIYGLDVQREGMLYAAILRPPVQGETGEAIDDAAARAVPGIVQIAAVPRGVAVIGETLGATLLAKRALRVKWTATAKARSYSSQGVMADYKALAADPGGTALAMVEQGDAPGAIAKAPRRLVADYACDHVAHACMEPMNATAQVGDGKIEFWVGQQAPTKIQAAVAKLANLPPEQIVVHSTLLGGGFGRRFEFDFAIDAYQAALLAPGRPVKLVFTREDDLVTDTYRPLVAQRMEVGLDANGAILGWQHRVVSQSYFTRTDPPKAQQLGFKDPLVSASAPPAYKFAAYRSDYVPQDRGIAVGALRGISAGYTVFAAECMIDEVAEATGQDPLALRLKLLEHSPRGTNVLKMVAEKAGWGRPTEPGRALGLAYMGESVAFIAAIASLSLDKASGRLRVHDIWCVFDGGLAIQPVNLEAQIEGALLFGMGVALFEQVTLTGGVTQESNFGEYRVLRMSDMPNMHVEILSTENPPGGAGEAGTPVIAPALANAIARLPGVKRVRNLPLQPALMKTLKVDEARL